MATTTTTHVPTSRLIDALKAVSTVTALVPKDPDLDRLRSVQALYTTKGLSLIASDRYTVMHALVPFVDGVDEHTTSGQPTPERFMLTPEDVKAVIRAAGPRRAAHTTLALTHRPGFEEGTLAVSYAPAPGKASAPAPTPLDVRVDDRDFPNLRSLLRNGLGGNLVPMGEGALGLPVRNLSWVKGMQSVVGGDTVVRLFRVSENEVKPLVFTVGPWVSGLVMPSSRGPLGVAEVESREAVEQALEAL